MGSDHPRVIATIDNLGYSYSKNKDYTAALSVSGLYPVSFFYSDLIMYSHCSFFSIRTHRRHTTFIVLQGNAIGPSIPLQHFLRSLL